jgi:hypothetical protein
MEGLRSEISPKETRGGIINSLEQIKRAHRKSLHDNPAKKTSGQHSGTQRSAWEYWMMNSQDLLLQRLVRLSKRDGRLGGLLDWEIHKKIIKCKKQSNL